MQMKNVLCKGGLLSFPLSGAGVNRHEKERKAEGYLQSRLSKEANPCAVICRGDGSMVLLAGDRPAAKAWLHEMGSPSGAPILNTARAVYVGEDEELKRNVFVAAADNVDPQIVENGTWVPSRVLLGDLDSHDGAVLGLSMSSLQWRASISFCPSCGARTEERDLGYSCACSACKRVHYPQVSPAMIVAVLDGNGSVLLSQRRKQTFTVAGRPIRTILAGFVSQGESMEETVAREVMEETGVKVKSVRYAGSQPWPYPFQLMTAYYAVADSAAPLRVEEEELVMIEWVTKEDVRRALAGDHADFVVPPPFTAAFVLLSSWVNGLVDDWGETVTPH